MWGERQERPYMAGTLGCAGSSLWLLSLLDASVGSLETPPSSPVISPGSSLLLVTKHPLEPEAICKKSL